MDDFELDTVDETDIVSALVEDALDVVSSNIMVVGELWDAMVV